MLARTSSIAADEPPLPTPERVRDALARHFLLRLDMMVILGGTFAAGLATTRMLLFLHVNHLAVRYGIAITVAFAAFLLFVRVWLAYVDYRARIAERSRDQSDGWFSSINFSSNGISMPGLGGGGDDASLAGGGGHFGGGGASGGWDDSAQPTVAVPLPVKASGSGGSGGWSMPDLGDDAGLVVLVIVFVLAIVLAVFYLVYAAPAVLSEAAFEAALTGALTHQARKARTIGWAGSVVKSTVLPFLAVLAIGVFLGLYAHKHCPTAIRLKDALHCVAR
jgi:hypothetical protein